MANTAELEEQSETSYAEFEEQAKAACGQATEGHLEEQQQADNQPKEVLEQVHGAEQAL